MKHEDFLDDKPVFDGDWHKLRDWRADATPHFTPGEAAKLGLVGLGLFVVAFAVIALALIYF